MNGDFMGISWIYYRIYHAYVMGGDVMIHIVKVTILLQFELGFNVGPRVNTLTLPCSNRNGEYIEATALEYGFNG